MKLLITFFLSMIICLQAFAAEIGAFEVNRLVDEFQYELEVNWDQKDKAVLVATKEKYLKMFEELRTQGLTAERLVTSLEPRLNTQQKIIINNTLSQYRLGLISDEQLTETIFSAVNESRPSGASWNGQSAVGIGLAVLATGFVGYVLVKVIINLSRCGVNPRYCCEYYGWTDTNGDGYCNADEEVH